MTDEPKQLDESDESSEDVIDSDNDKKSWREFEKDDVAEKFSSYQETLRERHAKKVTAEDLQERLDARREARRAKRAKEPKQRPWALRNWFAVALLVGAGVIALGISASYSNYTRESSANRHQILTLQGQLQDQHPHQTKQQQAAEAKRLHNQLLEAQHKASQVVSFQNEFAGLEHNATTSLSKQNGVPSDADVTLVKHRRALAPLFDASSYVVQGGQAYQMGSEDLLPAGQIDPRWPWYVRYDPTISKASGSQVASEPSQYSWKLVSVTLSESEDPTMTDVTWLCNDTRTNALLAWATASYSSERHNFNRLTVGTTTIGDQYAQGSQSSGSNQNQTPDDTRNQRG